MYHCALAMSPLSIKFQKELRFATSKLAQEMAVNSLAPVAIPLYLKLEWANTSALNFQVVRAKICLRSLVRLSVYSQVMVELTSRLCVQVLLITELRLAVSYIQPLVVSQ
jgi:hypothetical protein